jgi:hypothetical protein
MRRGLCWVALAGALATGSCIQAQEPREPGLGELIVVDPGVNEQGKPAVIIENGRVEIPPTLHVHPNYYCGDKEYQAQILQGGPTIIVANHPKSGEKLYIDAILPAGAPLVAYTSHTITYVYTDRRVCIEFCRLNDRKATVKYIGGRGLVREVHEQTGEIVQAVHEQKKKSRLVSELGELGTEVTDIAKGSAGVFSTAGAVAVERARAFTRILPGSALLRSIGQQSSERAAAEEARHAGKAAVEQITKDAQTIPTVR